MRKYVIGIDTGGTFTDAVLLDIESKGVIATAKRPTTHYQLAKGTGDALADLLGKTDINPADITTVAVSSTLATNTVVENKGARVAVIVIGYVKHFKLPVKAVVFVKGGHNIQGQEEEPLDIDYLVQLIEGLKNEVDAYGVCSAMSIKNPAHELVAEKAINMLDPKPVFCSHRISQLAGMEERAATSGLHAKLMPIMEEFVSGVQNAMDKRSLACDTLVIGGNGKPLLAATAIQEAALTVASGPACSAHFGSSCSRNNTDVLIVDVGGTTTDIAMIKNGTPLLTSEGCQIGRWKTHVEAIDMHTAGVGGDSLVYVDTKNNISIGPSRVTPLATAPDIPPLRQWLGTCDNAKLIILHPGSNQGVMENEITSILSRKGPITVKTIRDETGLGGIPLEKQLEQLTRKQLIYECGFTPTDALQVLGHINLGNFEMSQAGAEILGESLNLTDLQFAEKVVSITEELIENLIIDYLCNHYWDKSLHSFIATRTNHPALGVDFTVKLPLIGIGAAAKYFLPKVAENLRTTVFFPEHCEVGNAMGAALLGLEKLLSEISHGSVY